MQALLPRRMNLFKCVECGHIFYNVYVKRFYLSNGFVSSCIKYPCNKGLFLASDHSVRSRPLAKKRPCCCYNSKHDILVACNYLHVQNRTAAAKQLSYIKEPLHFHLVRTVIFQSSCRFSHLRHLSFVFSFKFVFHLHHLRSEKKMLNFILKLKVSL